MSEAQISQGIFFGPWRWIFIAVVLIILFFFFAVISTPGAGVGPVW